MSLIGHAMHHLAGLWPAAKKLVISRAEDGDAYMTRLYLVKTPAFAIYLHVFHRSDEPTPHDHPWRWASLLLAGQYDELLYDDRGELVDWLIRRRGSVVFRGPLACHRVLIPEGKRAVTLFVRGRDQRVWGFRTPDGDWTPHDRWTDEKRRRGLP